MVHPLKARVGPSIVKRGRREDFIGWVGVQGMGLKQLKVTSRGEDPILTNYFNPFPYILLG